jgi:hypothetical protein
MISFHYLQALHYHFASRSCLSAARRSDNRKIAVDYVRYLFLGSAPVPTAPWPLIADSEADSVLFTTLLWRQDWKRPREEEMKNDGNATHLILMK